MPAATVLLVISFVLMGCQQTPTVSSPTDTVPSAAPAPNRLRAVVHLNSGDPALQERTLKGIANIIGGARREGSEALIELVCHGDAIGLLMAEKTAHPDKLAALTEAGVVLAACNNTLKERGITREQLLPSVKVVPSAAIELIRKQQDGYAYLRP